MEKMVLSVKKWSRDAHVSDAGDKPSANRPSCDASAINDQLEPGCAIAAFDGRSFMLRASRFYTSNTNGFNSLLASLTEHMRYLCDDLLVG